MIRRVLSLLILAGAAAFGACYNEDAPTSVQHGVQTKILLTDAPFPYDSIGRVDIYIESIAASTGTDTTDSIGSGTEWVTVAEPMQRFNLLELQGGTTALLGEAELPAGQYRSLRMIINADSSAMTNIRGYTVGVNWGWTNRPKLYALVEEPMTAGGDSARIVIDFDVGRSFWPLPNGGFVLLPVLRAVNEAATGAVEGTVRGDSLAADPMPIGEGTITVYSGNPSAPEDNWSVRATGRTESNGRFVIKYLLPGTYIIRSDAPRSSPFSPGIRSNVVVARQVTTRNVDVTLPRRSAFNISLVPSSRQLVVGGSDSLFVYATDSLGQAIIGAAFTWSTSNSGIVSVTPLSASSVARIQGIAAGTATIQACYSGTCASSFITVGAAPSTSPVASVTVAPSSLNMFPGDSVTFGATLRDSAGNTLTGRPVTWHAADSTIRIRQDGSSNASIRALRVGTTTLFATSEGKQGSASVVVLGNSP